MNILQATFSPWQTLADSEHRLIESGELPAKGIGATASFVGTMRDFNEGDTVSAMQLSHYPGMTERELETLIDETQAKHKILAARIWHRVGDILPGEPIVLVAVWAAHRKAAFDACRELMEALKSRAPFWKKEVTKNGERWVAKNT